MWPAKSFGILTLALSFLAMPAVHGAEGEAKSAEVAPDVDADKLLEKASLALFPDEFTAKMQMVSTNADGEEQTYKMMLYKSGKDKARTDFIYPPLEEGRRMLRVGDQIWMYVADLKRPVKMSPKQSLMGSDFNNGDLMRLSFTEDYSAAVASADEKHYVLELTAKKRSVAYDRVLYTIEKDTMRSVSQEFFTKSGKKVKSLEFQDYKSYDGFERPSVFVMTNALATAQKSVVTYLEFEAGKSLPAAQFRPDAISRQ